MRLPPITKTEAALRPVRIRHSARIAAPPWGSAPLAGDRDADAGLLRERLIAQTVSFLQAGLRGFEPGGKRIRHHPGPEGSGCIVEKRYLVYTTDDLRSGAVDSTRVFRPARPKNRCLSTPVGKVGLAARSR